MISFTWPYAFLLLPLPYLIYKGLPKAEKTPIPLYMPGLAQHTLTESATIKQSPFVIFILLATSWLAFLTALAGPIHQGDPVKLPTSGRDLLLAVDISGSMQERDMVMSGRRTDRLTATKVVIDEFLSKRQGDRVGLILYGSTAYIQSPLTFDLKTVKDFLDETQIGFAGDGTAIGDAIGMSIKKLENTPKNERILILLSDGVNNTGALNPLKAAKFAKQEGIKIYTIALGQPGSRFPLDERTLAAIAQETGGLAFRARNSGELLQIYKEIDKLEPIDQDAEFFRPEKALFFWPLGLALLLLLIGVLLNRFPALPSRKQYHA